MKFPKRIVRHCPRCNGHTEHSVALYKAGKRRSMAEGQRRYEAKQRGYGSKRRPEQKRFAKVNKKVLVRLTCSQCGYKSHALGVRLKRVELVEVTR